MNTAQLETDLKATSAKVKALMDATMTACAETVVTAATATTPEVTGRLMTAEEKAAIQGLLDQGKAIKARLDGHANDAALSAEIAKLTAGLADRPVGGGLTPQVRKSMGQQLVDNPQ